MKRGFLLMNTGSPAAPNKTAVRAYLKEFLMDPHVIDLPFPLRALLVHGIILPRRPVHSAALYRRIWTDHGSPLIHHCTQLNNGLRLRLAEPIALGMTYGQPSYQSAVKTLLEQDVEEICLLPLFPQYATATTGACIDAVLQTLGGRATLRVAPPFYIDPAYIQPLADALKEVDEHVLFSYHGLPLRQLAKETKPNYRDQCLATTAAIVERAGIPADHYSIAFQSRLGRAQWIPPYTDEVLQELPQRGIKQLAVICPAFFCDCLETLEELGLQGREIFLAAGGESYRLLPCLNATPAALDGLESLMENVEQWTECR